MGLELVKNRMNMVLFHKHVAVINWPAP